MRNGQLTAKERRGISDIEGHAEAIAQEKQGGCAGDRREAADIEAGLYALAIMRLAWDQRQRALVAALAELKWAQDMLTEAHEDETGRPHRGCDKTIRQIKAALGMEENR